jgi:hypothetical protein
MTLEYSLKYSKITIFLKRLNIILTSDLILNKNLTICKFLGKKQNATKKY